MDGMQDQRVVVTGAASGIGREVATNLAQLGADVVLACRDPLKAQAVAADINATAGASRATVMALDVADPGSVESFAQAYRDAYGTLDVLINNAGILASERHLTGGLELTFATNVLGYHLVITELLPALRAAAPSRVVNIASTFAGQLDLDDLQFERRPYDGMAAYAQSKACDRMLTWAFARRLEGDGITVNAMAPGLVLDTALYRQLPADAKAQLAQLGARTVADGAETAIWLASSPDVEGVTGRFFEQRQEIPCEFRDEADEESLWHACAHLAGAPEQA